MYLNGIELIGFEFINADTLLIKTNTSNADEALKCICGEMKIVDGVGHVIRSVYGFNNITKLSLITATNTYELELHNTDISNDLLALRAQTQQLQKILAQTDETLIELYECMKGE